MRNLKHTVAIAALISIPLISHAEDTSVVTREAVRNELIAAELSGQFPTSKNRYPDPRPDRAEMYVAYKALLREASDQPDSPTSAGNSPTFIARVVGKKHAPNTRAYSGG